jgi:hypothetical protein
MDWIARSWSPLGFDNESDDYVLSFQDMPDDDSSYEALEKEQTIRAVVRNCVEEELSADFMRVQMIGLCRSLSALGHTAAIHSNEKQICMEAAGLIAVTASCEKMLRSVSGFKLVESFRFGLEDPDED